MEGGSYFGISGYRCRSKHCWWGSAHSCACRSARLVFDTSFTEQDQLFYQTCHRKFCWIFWSAMAQQGWAKLLHKMEGNDLRAETVEYSFPYLTKWFLSVQFSCIRWLFYKALQLTSWMRPRCLCDICFWNLAIRFIPGDGAVWSISNSWAFRFELSLDVACRLKGADPAAGSVL